MHMSREASSVLREQPVRYVKDTSWGGVAGLVCWMRWETEGKSDMV